MNFFSSSFGMEGSAYRLPSTKFGEFHSLETAIHTYEVLMLKLIQYH